MIAQVVHRDVLIRPRASRVGIDAMGLRAPRDDELLAPQWFNDAVRHAEQRRRCAWTALLGTNEEYGPRSPEYAESCAQWLVTWHTWQVAWAAAWQVQLRGFPAQHED
jgi:hypothetical protein